jgi:hypothetical protein
MGQGLHWTKASITSGIDTINTWCEQKGKAWIKSHPAETKRHISEIISGQAEDRTGTVTFADDGSDDWVEVERASMKSRKKRRKQRRTKRKRSKKRRSKRKRSKKRRSKRKRSKKN